MSPRPPSLPPAIQLPNSDARATVVDLRATDAAASRAGATRFDKPRKLAPRRRLWPWFLAGATSIATLGVAVMLRRDDVQPAPVPTPVVASAPQPIPIEVKAPAFDEATPPRKIDPKATPSPNARRHAEASAHSVPIDPPAPVQPPAARVDFVKRDVLAEEVAAGLEIRGLESFARALAREIEPDATLVEIQSEVMGNDAPANIRYLYYSKTADVAGRLPCVRVPYGHFLAFGRTNITAVRASCASRTPVGLPKCTYAEVAKKLPKLQNNTLENATLFWTANGWLVEEGGKSHRIEDCK
jgi:hypothetical protein